MPLRPGPDPASAPAVLARPLTAKQTTALCLLAQCERPRDPWGVLTVDRTAVYDGQAWINFHTVRSLRRLGLVEVDYDPEGSMVKLTEAGHREEARHANGGMK